MMDYRAHLERQMGFLIRSCEAYDHGCHDEAVRIAVVLRVLFHSTRSSTSLLRHLSAESVMLIDSRPPFSSHAITYHGLGMHVVGEKNEFVPNLNRTPMLNPPAPLLKWWEQTVFVLQPGVRLTRRDLVLAAANKDGGAHVDVKLTPEYERLASDGALGEYRTRREDNLVIVPAIEAHLASIRQIGFEVVESSEVLALLEKY